MAGNLYVIVLIEADESTLELWADWVLYEGYTMGEAVARSRIESSPFWLFIGIDQAAGVRERRPSRFTYAMGSP